MFMRVIAVAICAIPSLQADDFERLVEPFEIIQMEGQLRLSDGISIFAFNKDGTFELIPLFKGGRVIHATWKQKWPDRRGLLVAGEWRWTDGFRVPIDYRIMHLRIQPISSKRMYSEISNLSFSARLRNGSEKIKIHNCEFKVERIESAAAKGVP